MKTTKLLFITIILLFITSFQSCDDDDDTDNTPQTPEEFIADDSTFADFENWTLVATETGVGQIISGGAHNGNLETSVREIYFKENNNLVNGELPVGTVIVKHTSDTDNSSINAYTAMVKRGNNFSPDHNDWEWFILNADGSIGSDDSGALRGGGDFKACATCHSAAAATDYSFSK